MAVGRLKGEATEYPAFNDGTRPGDSAEILYEFASALWVNKIDAYGSNETGRKSKSAILYVGDADGDVSSTEPCDDVTSWTQVGDELFFAPDGTHIFCLIAITKYRGIRRGLVCVGR